MSNNTKHSLESIVENILWKSRIITFLAVVFSLISSLALFIAGSIQILNGIIDFVKGLSDKPEYLQLVIAIISAVDLYLIGIVLLIFSFGIYELFISKIDPAQNEEEVNILEIRSLDSLKNKLLKVIIMVLIVYFFKTILASDFHKPIEMLYLGASILMISTCTYFIRKIED